MLAKTLFAVVVGLALTEPLPAGSVTGAEIVEYGLFETVSIGSRKETAVLAGQIDEVPMAKLIERSAIIPAVLGTSFGISVKLTVWPVGERVKCWNKWLHPCLLF